MDFFPTTRPSMLVDATSADLTRRERAMGLLVSRLLASTCWDNFVTNDRIASQRQKRGGGMVFKSLDFAPVEAEVLRNNGEEGDAAACFYKQWVRSFFDFALQQLRKECTEQGEQRHFRMWQR